MTNLQPELLSRLERIAKRQNRSLEQLLSDFVDDSEQTQFRGNPYTLLDKSPALVAVSDWEGNFLYVNDAFCNALGYERRTLLTQFTSFIHPDDLEETIAIRQTLEDGKALTQFENRYRHANSSYRWFSWTAIPNQEYVYSIAFDISEQKKIEEKLRQSLEENRRLHQIAFDGYLVGDRDGHILEVNQRYCELLGYTRSELLSMKVFDLDAALSEPEIRSNATRVVQQDQPMHLVTRHRHKDGHLVDVEINSVPIREEKIACFIKDISKRENLERRLRQSEQYYKGLVESQIDFVCRYTPDTVLKYVNDAYCHFFGRTQDELIGTSFLTLTGESADAEIHARIKEVLQDPSPEVRAFHTYDSLGQPKWIQWIDYGILDNDGNVIEIQAIGRDITELMDTKEKLAEREIMLSTIFNNIPVMVAQFDASGNFEYVNKHWIDLLGWTVPEMQQHPDIMAAFYPDPEYRQEALDYMLAAEPGWREFETHTKDGEIVHTSWANVRLSDNRSIGIGIDLSDRVKIEERLQASEEQYRNLVETAHDLIWSVDVDGKITYINQASEQIYGYKSEEMIGRFYQDFVPEEQLEVNNTAWQIAIENNDRLFNFENWVQNRDGDRILLNTNVVLQRDNDGNVVGSMGTAQNIIHRHELENQRLYAAKLEFEIEKEREIQQTKDRFVSLVSHEFRTPLAVMQTSTSLITRYIDQLPKESIVQKLETNSQQIERMVNLMEDTLRFGKTSAGKVEVQPESIKVKKFLREVIDTQSTINQNRHTIILEGEDGTIEADVKLLDHVFSNLLSNALKYSPENSTVTISAEQLISAWQFKVIDEGIGIPDEDLPKLFEPFHRASNALDKAGTGLGLSIVKEYVEVHGGLIDVNSEIGVGTTVTIRL